MIVRIWWPLQDTLRRRPPLAAFLLLGVGAVGLAGIVEVPHAREAALLAGVAIILQVHAVALQILALCVLLPTLAVAQALDAGSDGLLWIAAAAALILGPAADQLRRIPVGLDQHACGRSTAWTTLAAQFVALGTIERPWLLAGAAVLVVVGAGVLPAAAIGRNDQRLDRSFASVPAPGRGWFLAGLVLIGIDIALPRPVTVGESGWSAWIAPLVWLGLTQRPWPVIGACIASAAVVQRHGAHALDADALLGHLPPLLLWLAREPQRGFPAPTLIAVHVLMAAMALAHPRWSSAALIAGILTTWIALGPSFASRSVSTARERIHRGLHRQPPAWRWYHFAKWRLDPLYRRLLDDPVLHGRVLDLGCGSGLVTAIAAADDRVDTYLGIDLDADKLHLAEAWQCDLEADRLRHRLRLAHLPAASIEDGWDTVCCLDVLHYWPREDQVDLLRWAGERLAPDGRLILREGVATAGDAGRVGRGEAFTTWIGLNPRRKPVFLDRADLDEAFAASGLVVLNEEPCGGENRLFVLARQTT